MSVSRDIDLFGRHDQPFTLHYYIGRDGGPMVSVTLLNGNHSVGIALSLEQMRLLSSIKDAILFQTLGSPSGGGADGPRSE